MSLASLLRRVVNRAELMRRNGLLRTARIAVDSAALRSLGLAFGFPRWHSQSPTSARPYRECIAAMINALHPRSVVEVGCGLGAILVHVKADKRTGYDTDAKVIRGARFLRGSSIRFIVGGFEDVPQSPRDVLVAVNMLHDFSPEQVERWITPLLPTSRYLLLDRIDRASPLAYRFYHDFAFLDGKAAVQHIDSCGEAHRAFTLYEVNVTRCAISSASTTPVRR